MKTVDYYKHARSLGAFTSSDCLQLARKAVELDHQVILNKIPKPIVVWYEVNPDGTHAKFSQGITVY